MLESKFKSCTKEDFAIDARWEAFNARISDDSSTHGIGLGFMDDVNLKKLCKKAEQKDDSDFASIINDFIKLRNDWLNNCKQKGLLMVDTLPMGHPFGADKQNKAIRAYYGEDS